LTAAGMNRPRAAPRSTCGPASTIVTRAPARARLQPISAPATPAPTIRTSLCSVTCRLSSKVARRRSPAFRTAIARARRWIDSSGSPHQRRIVESYGGRSVLFENARVPAFEQSLLDRAAAVGFWFETGQIFNRDAGAKSKLHAGPSDAG